jgi:hypothetical protein
VGDVEVMVDVAVKELADSCFGVCKHPDHGAGGLAIHGRITVGSGNLTAYGSEVCLVGATVTSNCNHSTGTITSGASKTSKGSDKLAIVGSPFTGVYTGTVIKGEPKMQVV